MKEIILHDDGIPSITKPVVTLGEEPKKPIIEMPSLTVEKETPVKIKPVDNKTRDLIILIVLIVLIVGAFMVLNFINNRKALNATPAV